MFILISVNSFFIIRNHVFTDTAARMFDQLSSLDTSRTNWKIKVRVTRMWASVASQSGGKDALKGYNLILLDDDVSLKPVVYIVMILTNLNISHHLTSNKLFIESSLFCVIRTAMFKLLFMPTTGKEKLLRLSRDAFTSFLTFTQRMPLVV